MWAFNPGPLSFKSSCSIPIPQLVAPFTLGTSCFWVTLQGFCVDGMDDFLEVHLDVILIIHFSIFSIENGQQICQCFNSVSIREFILYSDTMYFIDIGWPFRSLFFLLSRKVMLRAQRCTAFSGGSVQMDTSTFQFAFAGFLEILATNMHNDLYEIPKGTTNPYHDLRFKAFQCCKKWCRVRCTDAYLPFCASWKDDLLGPCKLVDSLDWWLWYRFDDTEGTSTLHCKLVVQKRSYRTTANWEDVMFQL